MVFTLNGRRAEGYMCLPGALTDTLLRFTAQFISVQTNPRPFEDHRSPAFDTTSWGKMTKMVVYPIPAASQDDSSSEPWRQMLMGVRQSTDHCVQKPAGWAGWRGNKPSTFTFASRLSVLNTPQNPPSLSLSLNVQTPSGVRWLILHMLPHCLPLARETNKCFPIGPLPLLGSKPTQIKTKWNKTMYQAQKHYPSNTYYLCI